MASKPIVILRAGDAAPPVAARYGQFAGWIQRTAGAEWQGAWQEIDVRTDAPLPSVDGAAAFVMTGSSSSVTERAPWMLRAEAFVREIAEVGAPFLGLCFGHQLAATALGGEVAKNPRGREIGTVSVHCLGADPLFDGLGPNIAVNATHVDSVTRLPAGARLLAASELEPTQAFALGEAMRCVQFHPEFDGNAMRAYIEARAHLIAAEGGDAEALLAKATDCPQGEAVLRNFVRRFVSQAARAR